jgi:hypothetical protein
MQRKQASTCTTLLLSFTTRLTSVATFRGSPDEQFYGPAFCFAFKVCILRKLVVHIRREHKLRSTGNSGHSDIHAHDYVFFIIVRLTTRLSRRWSVGYSTVALVRSALGAQLRSQEEWGARGTCGPARYV